MAAVDIVRKQWGTLAGGTGVDNTTVYAGDVYVKRLILTSNDSADTITITDAAGGVIVDWKAPTECVTVVEVGAKIKGLKVNPSVVDAFVSIIEE